MCVVICVLSGCGHSKATTSLPPSSTAKLSGSLKLCARAFEQDIGYEPSDGSEPAWIDLFRPNPNATYPTMIGQAGYLATTTSTANYACTLTFSEPTQIGGNLVTATFGIEDPSSPSTSPPPFLGPATGTPPESNVIAGSGGRLTPYAPGP